MRVLVTGATGFVGSFLVPELIAAGHDVVAFTRSDALLRAGVEVVRGDVNDLPALLAAAEQTDAVVHTAFDHNATDIVQASENDRAVIAALGVRRPLVVTSGTGLVRSATGGPVVESDPHPTSAVVPRAATEEAAEALLDQGGHVVVIRLPQVHDTRRQGRITRHIQIAREQGRVAYVGDGRNRVPAVHVSDAVRLYRLALENGRPGARYHAVAEDGIALSDIADAIGSRLGLPVESIAPDEAPAYYGALAPLAVLDLPASGAVTRQELDWTPTGPDLLTDLRNLADT